jgi:hypothetical protein
MGKIKNTYKISDERFESKRSFEKPRHRYENSIRVDLNHMWCKLVDRIYLALANMIMNL